MVYLITKTNNLIMNQTITQDVLASKGIRFLNFIIDYIVFIIVSFVIGAAIGFFSEITGNYALYDFIVYNDSLLFEYAYTIVIWTIYYTTMETLTGKSIGKFITKSQAVMADGSKLTFEKALVRSLCRFIPFEQFSFLGEGGKGWHDSITKTFVVDDKKFREKQETDLGLEELGKPLE